MSAATDAAKAIIGALAVLDEHAPERAEQLRAGWNLSWPLAQLLDAGHVLCVTATGRDELMAMRDECITAAHGAHPGLPA